MSRLNDYIELPTRKLNRLSARSPKSGLYWCSGCDANLVGTGEKCRVCGYQEKEISPKNDLT